MLSNSKGRAQDPDRAPTPIGVRRGSVRVITVAMVVVAVVAVIWAAVQAVVG